MSPETRKQMATRNERQSPVGCGCEPEEVEEEEPDQDYDLLECLGDIDDKCEDVEDEDRRECLVNETASCIRGLDE